MKVGDLVKIVDENKQQWAKYNPWMKIVWKMDDIWVIVETGDMATISKKF